MTEIISKPVYRVLSDLTQESRVEAALPLAIKDWVRLRLKEAQEQREVFRTRYGMDFQAFQEAWKEGRIPDEHSYEVERDYWEWEAAVTDTQRLQEMQENLLRPWPSSRPRSMPSPWAQPSVTSPRCGASLRLPSACALGQGSSSSKPPLVVPSWP